MTKQRTLKNSSLTVPKEAAKLIEWDACALYNSSLMMFRGLFLSVVFALFFSPYSASAAVHYESKATQTEVSLENPATITLFAEWPKSEGSYSFRLPALITPHLKIIRQGQSRETFRKDSETWLRQVFEIELIPVDESKTGFLQSALLTLTHDETGEESTFLIPEYQFTTQSKRTLSEPVKFAIGLIGVSLILVLSLTLYLLLRKRNQEKRFKASPQSQESDIAIGLKKLLEEETRTQEQKLVLLSQKLKDSVMKYYRIESRGSLTDSELIKKIEELKMDHEEKGNLLRLMQELRDAKYLGQTPNEADLKEYQTRVIQFISSKRAQGGAL